MFVLFGGLFFVRCVADWVGPVARRKKVSAKWALVGCDSTLGSCAETEQQLVSARWSFSLFGCRDWGETNAPGCRWLQ